jgi:catechol 2,3-dioxygenase-like lactoylglutathione lyase family enzyme
VFDHIGIVVSNLAVARAFYSSCLAALGVEMRPSFWQDSHVPSSSPDHLAFTAPDDRAVDAFYRAGLSNGGRDNGPPGPRKSSTRCYAAFLIDPDGNNVEASHRE